MLKVVLLVAVWAAISALVASGTAKALGASAQAVKIAAVAGAGLEIFIVIFLWWLISSVLKRN